MDQTLAVTKQGTGEVSHLLHTQLLCQGGAHLILEPALLAAAETAPGNGNCQLGSSGFAHTIREAQSLKPEVIWPSLLCKVLI